MTLKLELNSEFNYGLSLNGLCLNFLAHFKQIVGYCSYVFDDCYFLKL